MCEHLKFVVFVVILHSIFAMKSYFAVCIDTHFIIVSPEVYLILFDRILCLNWTKPRNLRPPRMLPKETFCSRRWRILDSLSLEVKHRVAKVIFFFFYVITLILLFWWWIQYSTSCGYKVCSDFWLLDSAFFTDNMQSRSTHPSLRQVKEMFVV